MNNGDTLKKIISKNKTRYLQVLKSRYPEILKWVEESTPLLSDKFYTLKTKIYWVLNGLKTFPTCKKCGKEIRKNVESINIGYHDTCSVKCASNMVDRINKIKNTCLNKYGVENYTMTKEFQDKSKQTCLEKYGVEYSFQSDNNKNKSKQTCLEKYGVENARSCKSVQEKAKKTCIERYGVDNVFKSNDIKERIRKTNIEKYGVTHAMKSSVIREKISKSSRNRSLEDSWDNIILKDEYSSPNFTKEFFISNYDSDFEFEFKCKKCGRIFKSRHYDGTHKRCPKCFPNTSSSGEYELYEFITSIYKGIVIRNSRDIISPYEIDIFIKDKKIAFEFDGLYWHSFQTLRTKNKNIDKFYHMNKTKMCEEKGITLIHIFEDEWNSSRDIVKSRIKNILGIHDKTVFARKCTVKSISNEECRTFLNENHLQGSVNSSVSLGLFFKNELISIMTFGKMRIALGSKSNNDNEYELLRFCSLLNYHVIGGAGKLLRFFENNYNPSKITTYADRRWSSGNLYDKLGFKYKHTSVPNYWYMDGQCLKRIHRFNFMKSKLGDKLKDFDETLSEKQNMENNGYRYIYDCGNMVFVKEYDYQNKKPQNLI